VVAYDLTSSLVYFALDYSGERVAIICGIVAFNAGLDFLELKKRSVKVPAHKEHLSFDFIRAEYDVHTLYKVSG